MSTTMLHATVPASQDEAPILAVLDTMREALFEKDPHKFVSAFTADAAVYNLAPPLMHHGVDPAEKQAWFDSWLTPLELEPRDFKVTVSGDYAFAFGFLRLGGTKKGSEGKVNFWMRETVCLHRENGEWRIVHEHTSVPFYMDGTFRGAFDLRP
ncbi:MAG TPA: nuclear transport factor 2 family protein [Terracidiphilus sp.]|nr:nuclear transport factor 2 family protein [Terracidiphilus sp.]